MLLDCSAKPFGARFQGTTLYVHQIDADKLPSSADKDDYTTFYAVRNFDAEGVIFMYLGKGNKDAPSQIVAWYPNGAFWSSYGLTIKDGH